MTSATPPYAGDRCRSLREVMNRLGHSTTVAALRYQHVIADRDAAIARELNRLIEGAVSAAMAPRWHAGPKSASVPV